MVNGTHHPTILRPAQTGRAVMAPHAIPVRPATRERQVRVTRYRNGHPILDTPPIETRTHSGSIPEVTAALDEEPRPSDDPSPLPVDPAINMPLGPDQTQNPSHPRLDSTVPSAQCETATQDFSTDDTAGFYDKIIQDFDSTQQLGDP